MFQKCTVSAVLAAILALTASAALAQTRQTTPTISRPAPLPGEQIQTRGVVEDDMGMVYRPRR